MTKSTLLLALIAAAPLVQADIEVIYGVDNRQDIYQVKSSAALTLAKSTAAMIPVSLFTKTAKQGVFNLSSSRTLEDGAGVCASEAFSQQPLAANCSGFLVAPDTIVTAGHCYKSFSTPENVCKSFAWVFDYNMKSENFDPTKNISINNIYLCKSVVKAQLTDGVDFAVIKLNRAVVGRAPLKFRKTGKVADTARLTVIGHPSGLPAKVSDGGKIIDNKNATMFVTTLDTFQGNSGSAVFDSATGMVEGILVQGKTDYVPSKKGDEKSCKVVNKCDERGFNCASGKEEQSPPGEIVFRVSNVAKFVK